MTVFVPRVVLCPCYEPSHLQSDQQHNALDHALLAVEREEIERASLIARLTGLRGFGPRGIPACLPARWCGAERWRFTYVKAHPYRQGYALPIVGNTRDE